MKQILIINPHSLIDVITNSSTELFLADTDKTVEFIKDFLADLADMMDYPSMCGFENIYEVNEYNVDSVLSTLELYINTDRKNLIGKIVLIGEDSSIPYAIWELINEKFNSRNIHLG